MEQLETTAKANGPSAVVVKHKHAGDNASDCL